MATILFDNDDGNILGVYISGYHITTLIVNTQSGTILPDSYQRRAINSHGSAAGIISACTTVIKQALKRPENISAIGIAMPGPFDYDNGISFINSNKKHQALYGLNVKKMLSAELNFPADQICMINDAVGFLKGEAYLGVAKGFENLIGLAIGTGLGTARIINGQAEDALLWDAPFLDGIAEDYLSEKWLLRRYYELSAVNVTGIKQLAAFYNTSVSVRLVFKEFAANLGAFAAAFAKTFNPQAIVLSGDVAQYGGNYFITAFRQQLSREGINIPVLMSELNAHAVMIGAATCWVDEVDA